MISDLRVKNFKGISGDYTLSSKTLIIGPNFSGKTALLEAIKLAMIGYIPNEKNGLTTASAIFTRSSGSTMEAIAEIKQLEHCGCVRIRSVGGKLSMESRPIFTTNTVEYEMAAALIDPNCYFSATGPGRINMLVSLMSNASVEQPLYAGLEQLSMVNKKLTDNYTSKIRSLPEFRNEVAPGPVKIEAVAELLKKSKSEANAVAKRMKGTAQGLSDLSAIDSQLKSLPALSEIDLDLQTLNDLIEEISREIGTLQQRRADKIQFESDMQAFEGMADTDWTAKIEEAQKVIAALKAQIENHIKESKLLKAEYKDLTDKEHKKSVALQDIRSTFAQETKRLKELDVEDSGSWQTIKELEAQDLDSLSGEFRADCRIKLNRNAVEVLQINKVWVVVEKDVEAIENLQAELSQLSDIIETYEECIEDIHGRLSQIESNLNELDDQRESDEEAKESWQCEIDHLRQQQTYKKSVSNDTESLESIEYRLNIRRSDLAESKAKVSKMQATRSSVERFNQDKSRITQAGKELEAVQSEIDFISEIEKVLKNIRTRLIDDVIAGALEIANKFAHGILKSPLAYSDGQIGRIERGAFISINEFSGAEMLLSKMAFGVALASRLPGKIALIDELSTLDDERKVTLLENLVLLVDLGVISQFIAIDNREPEFYDKELQIIKTEEPIRTEDPTED